MPSMMATGVHQWCLALHHTFMALLAEQDEVPVALWIFRSHRRSVDGTKGYDSRVGNGASGDDGYDSVK